MEPTIITSIAGCLFIVMMVIINHYTTKDPEPTLEKPLEIRSRLQDNALKLPNTRNPHMEWTFRADDYRRAVEEYNEDLRFGDDFPAWPKEHNYWGWVVSDDSQESYEQWNKDQLNRPDHQLVEYMEETFKKIATDDPLGLEIKTRLQLLWDNTLVPIVDMRNRTGERGEATYQEQISLLHAIVSELKFRYEAGMTTQQSIHTNYLRALAQELSNDH